MAGTRYFIIDKQDRIPGNKKLRPGVITKAVNRKIGLRVLSHHGFLRVSEGFMRKNVRALVAKLKSGLVEIRSGSVKGARLGLGDLKQFGAEQSSQQPPTPAVAAKEEKAAEVINIKPPDPPPQNVEQSDVWASSSSPSPSSNLSLLTKKDLIEKILEKGLPDQTEGSLNRLNKDSLIELLEE